MTTPASAAPFVEMKLSSDGSLLAFLIHGPSGTRWSTDAPRDNGGEGSSFSPTDMIAISLADCMVTTMAIIAKREGLPWGKCGARVEKHMVGPPRRVGEVVVEIDMPKELPENLRPRFEEIAHGCPVARSLHPDLKQTVRFQYSR